MWKLIHFGSILVAVRSKALVCDHLIDGIAGSNPAEGMDVHLLFDVQVTVHRDTFL